MIRKLGPVFRKDDAQYMAGRKKSGRGSDPRPLWFCFGIGRSRSVAPDVDVLCFGKEQEADNKTHQGDSDRIPEAGIDVSSPCHYCEHGRRQKAAEPAVADVV